MTTKLALVLSVVAFAAVAGQEQDATVILPEEELAELRMAQGIAACDRLEGQERQVCLANLSLAAGDPAPCEADPTGECSRMASRVAMSGCGVSGSEEERVACEMKVASRYAEPDACELSVSSPLCLGIVAIEREDPTILEDRIDDPKTRQQMLGYYSLNTGDTSALDSIEDNHWADTMRIAAETAKAARTGEPLDPGFCWTGLRGDYQERDSYTENFDGVQVQCAAMVRWVNDLNAVLASVETSVETPAEEAALLQSLQRMLERLESGDESVLPSGEELERMAGIPPTLPEATEVDELRGNAEQQRARCDFVGALDTANALREAVARWNAALEATGEAGAAPQREGWLAAYYDEVAAKAAQQREFRTLLAAARDIYVQTAGAPTESDLDTAHELAALARTKALADPGCAEAWEADALLQTVADARAMLAEIRAEREAAEAAVEEDTELDGGRGEPSGGGEWAAGVREDAEDEWTSGSRSDEIDPCAGPRPEYEAALARMRAAFARRDIDAILAALADGALASTCPGDRERLESLGEMGVRLARAEADAKASRMASAVGQASAAAAQRSQMWTDAAAGLDRMLGEYNRARAAASADPGLVEATSAWAAETAGTTGAAGSEASAASGAAAGGSTLTCLVDPEVARSSSPGDPFWVNEAPAGGGLRGFKILQLAARPRGGGATFHGPYDGESVARRELERLCPAAKRATGSVVLQ